MSIASSKLSIKAKLEADLISKIRKTKNGEFLREIEDPSDALIRTAILLTPDVIRHVQNQTEEISLLAVGKDGNALRFIKNPTDSVIEKAIQTNSCALRFVENQKHEHCLMAVSRGSSGISALEYVHEQTEDIVLAALDAHPNLSVKYIRKMTPRIAQKIIQLNSSNIGLITDQNEELCLQAVRAKPTNLKWIRSQTDTIVWTAIKDSPNASARWIEYADNPTEAMCLYAVNKDPAYLEYIRKIHQTAKVCEAAVSLDARALKHVIFQTESIVLSALDSKYVPDNISELLDVFNDEIIVKLMKVSCNNKAILDLPYQTVDSALAAVKKFGSALKHVNIQTPEIVKSAINHNFRSIRFAHNQTIDIKLQALKINAESIQLFHGLITNDERDLFIKTNPFSIRWLQNVTPEEELKAVQLNWKALQYVKDRNENVCMEAYRQDVRSLMFLFPLFAPEPIDELFENDPIDFDSSETQLLALLALDTERSMSVVLNDVSSENKTQSRKRMDHL